MTIRQRLTLWFASLLTIIIIVFGVTVYFVLRIQMLDALDQTLNDAATVISEHSQFVPAPIYGGMLSFEINLASLDVFSASGVYVQAWQISNSTPVLKATSIHTSQLVIPLDMRAIGSVESQYSNVTMHGHNLRVLTQPITFDGRLVGNLQVAGDMTVINQISRIFLIIMAITSSLAILGAGGISLWFSQRALNPIKDITFAASNIVETDDLQTRLKWDGPADELGRLIEVFNQMMGRIEGMFTVQKRFVADISHELRTPLTALRGNIDLMKRYGSDKDSLEAVEIETDRMSRLVNSLLMLARADYGSLKFEMYPVDLDSVVNDVFVDNRDQARVKIKLDQIEPLQVQGDYDRLRQMIFNLLDNAIKFNKDDGAINIGLKRQDNHALLWIKDEGIGISEDDIHRIFDRFYQVDSSRNHDSWDGFGLGLSIARWIVDMHGGKIKVDSQIDMGTTVFVELPLKITKNPDDGV